MPRKVAELSAKQVRDLKKKGSHSVGGVPGLKLQISSENAKSWILRVIIGKKRREIGLGGFPEVSLSSARDKARELKEQIRLGRDPIAEKKILKVELIKEQNLSTTFAKVAIDAHKVKLQEFKNIKHSNQWINTLQTYAFPVLGELSINDVDVNDVIKVLKPIWSVKTETATRVRQRIAAVFDHALARGIRTNPNPADWNRLKGLLPNPEKLKKKHGKANQHHPAMQISDIHRFTKELSRRKGNGARALEFAILTAARSNEVYEATWDEIDLNNAIWRISGDRMKKGKAHSVPLSDRAVALLKSLPRYSEVIFANKNGLALSNNTMRKTLIRIHDDDVAAGRQGYVDADSSKIATPHGFRSTFKDWSRLEGRYPDEWSELALAHVNNDQTRAAYARNQLINERAGMMQDWASFIYEAE